MTNAVKEALDEEGYNAKLRDDVEMKILNPEIKFEVRKGLRKISGTFKLLLYSKSNEDIIWEKDMDLSFREEDSVEGIAVGSLEQGAPDFLTIKNETQFSSSKVEKIRAGVVAGIITYLLYSVGS